MSSFCLIYKDTGFEAIFARMLQLELECAGYTVQMASIPLNLKRSDLYIISAEYPGFENIILSLIPPHAPIVVYGDGDAPEIKGEKYGARLHYFKRPFLTEDFLEKIGEIAGSIVRDEENCTVSYPKLTLQGSKCGCTYGSEFISLSGREYDLLEFLYLRRGTAVSRAEILKEVWKDEPCERTNVVDVYISYLRKKIDQRLGTRFIKTQRNEGYMLMI